MASDYVEKFAHDSIVKMLLNAGINYENEPRYDTLYQMMYESFVDGYVNGYDDGYYQGCEDSY